MAIFKPGSTPPGNSVSDGLLYQTPTLTTPHFQKSNNNLTHTKGYIRGKRLHGTDNGTFSFQAGVAGFPNLNRIISGLDGIYETLPNQFEWETYAGVISGAWSLCASCEPDPSGKKIFRQVNFNRYQQGLPLLTTPPSTPPVVGGSSMTLTFQDSHGSFPALVDLNWVPDLTGLICRLMGGKGALNVSYSPIETDRERPVFIGPTFEFGELCVEAAGIVRGRIGDQGAVLFLCWSDGDGNPGLNKQIFISYIQPAT